MDNVPSIKNLGTQEALNKIHKYLQSNKQEQEFWVQTLGSASQKVDVDLSGIFGDLDISLEDIKEWNKIKDITDKLGNVIASKIQGNISTAIARIMNTNSTMVIDDLGVYFHSGPTEEEATWAMRLGAAGFMIANGKIEHPETNTWEWNWRTFGTGEGFTADDIVAGTLYALTINGCNILATNITGGTIKGVEMSTAKLTGNTIIGGTIEGTTIKSPYFEGGYFDGAIFDAGEINAAVINASTFNTATLNTPTITAGTIKGATIEGNALKGNTITGGRITGAIVESMGELGDGVSLYDKGYYVFGEGGTLASSLMYDTTGAGTAEEAANRVLFGTKNGYAMKIYSDGDMSITPKEGKKIYIGDCIFAGSTNIGNELKSIDYYSDGFMINNKDKFKWLSTTQLKHLNSGKIITISEHNIAIS